MNLPIKQLDMLADFYESAKSFESVFVTCERTGLIDKFAGDATLTLIPETENTIYVGEFRIALSAVPVTLVGKLQPVIQ